ncbi:hypothetical protein L207DRAFT_634003 [Hyaloscypha variabilis F]|uniref:pH-response transcription factor pacC/RIM101 n=1 Tax=Hyaloscypha variabilis (strain UAMH 11265 / GT02V1 / F) TaxID=1149755 RepID=A0A2J6RLJ5_HYAVF|nr:hypothetical protein L207DRAFT_634003 [Hyaloscypha variabilis F]
MDLLCHAIGFSETQLSNGLDPERPKSPLLAEDSHRKPAPSRSSNRRCHICGRCYERADHLNRHLKSHENARPHKCNRCSKSFNRADLLNRHQAAHDRPPAERPAIERGNRAATACIACVNAKAKCQDQKPCTRCQARGMPCQTFSDGAQSKRARSSSNLESGSQVDEDYNEIPSSESLQHFSNVESGQHTSDPAGPYNTNSMAEATTLDPMLAAHDISSKNFQYNSHPTNSTYYNEIQDSSALNTAFPTYEDITIRNDGHFDQDFGLVPRSSYFSQDLDFGMWDFDLDTIELAGINDSNTSLSGTDQNHSPKPSSRMPKDASRRYAAFERSPWLWTPTKNDQTMIDQQDLNLDEDNIPAVLTPASPAASIDEFTSCCIHHKERDKMLSLLFAIPAAPTSKSPYLPSLNLLNSIIQVYFVQESFKVDQLIHVGTFDPSKTLPQLLTAIVAAGSSFISTPAIWKMGLALQEVVRHSCANYWEADNSNTRSLQVLQAFMIGLDIGLWSGFKRKMEIAESFAQPIVIMLRRAGAFASTANLFSADPRLEDSEAVLESKWRKWAERESFKRLVLHLFIHDIQASIGLQKPPLISVTELKFLLPAARNLWLAKSATQWRDLFLSSHRKYDVPAFSDAIHQTNLHQYSSQADIPLTAIALLHGHWGQIYSLNESKKFFPSSKSTHRLWLHTAYTELYQDLSSFSLLIPSVTNNSTRATLIAEFLQMVLHISLEDLHRFAGKFGEDETRKAGEEFVAWAKTKEARIAIWHAGQVFRAAKGLMQAQNRGFNAIMLYYATLTLWAYGHAISSAEDYPRSTANQNVILNETETSSSTLFLASSQGLPFLNVTDGGSHDGKTLVPLTEPDKVLGVARDIYSSNYPVLEERLPPLVENLCILLKDLGSLPGSRISRAPSEGVNR